MAYQRHYRTYEQHINDDLNKELSAIKIQLLESRLSLSMLRPLIVFAKENPDVMSAHHVDTGASFKELRA